MKPILSNIIKQIHEKKKANNIWPDFVTLMEIRIEILSMTEDQLSQMVKEKELKTGSTVNSEYFIKI